MKKFVVTLMAITLAAAAWAQPKPKSQKEVEALQAIFNATGPDARIAAVDNLLLKFADTQFKSVALQLAAQSAQEKNDFEKMVIYGERALEADSKNYMVMLMLGSGYAQRTREHDLDKEDKLKTAEKYANSALELLKTAAKPRPDISDDQWNAAKKDFTAQGYETLGMVAMTRKKPDDAIAQFKLALEAASTQDATTKVRLATAYNQAQNYDEAIKLLDPILADPNTNPAVKQFAGNEKVRAVTGKAAKK